mmetsp:Transcript_60609/g.107977  ORF Transcript_60609/g.107977 Transcript_60609/m.107977 type:complete len:86 (-) Transcript_60609:1-258(-)
MRAIHASRACLFIAGLGATMPMHVVSAISLTPEETDHAKPRENAFGRCLTSAIRPKRREQTQAVLRAGSMQGSKKEACCPQTVGI